MPNYHLTELINSLSKEELRNFKIYVSRINGQSDSDSKNLSLFDYIKVGDYDEFSDKLLNKLYPDNNKNAFYRLKNRLINDIEQSLLLLNRNKDPRFKVYNTIQLANIFRYKSDYDQAFKYLVKAEKAAEKYGYQDLLDIIYAEILNLAGDYYKIDPQYYIEKKRDNYEVLGKEQEVDFLIAAINHKMRSTNYASREDFGDELEKIIEDLSISKDVSKNPDVQFKIHKCVRTILLQKRDFTGLEAYLLSSLDHFQEMGYFDSARYEELFRIYHWLINCSHIDFNFTQAKEYIDLLHKALTAHNKKYYEKNIWTYHESLIVHYSFTNQSGLALELMVEILENPEYSGTNFYDIFVPLNLSVAYYKEEQLDKAMGTLVPLIVSKNYTKLSRLFQLHISITDVIFHFEKGDSDYVIYKVNELKRIFRKEFKLVQFAREKKFLALISDIASKAEPFKNKKVLRKINEFISDSPSSITGNIEAIIFKFWLISKMTGRLYKDVLDENMIKDRQKMKENVKIHANTD